MPTRTASNQVTRRRFGPPVRVLVAMTVTAWIAILPLTWAWWSLLGMFG